MRWHHPTLLLAVCSALSCGRTGLESYDTGSAGAPTEPGCTVADDCPRDDLCVLYACEAGTCVEATRRSCPVVDACSAAACKPATGGCEVSPLTYDLDGDGFRGPLPGFEPGADGACGDDCDDTHDSAFPGGAERCDGVDNDCNGVVDDGAAYAGELTAPVRLSSLEFDQSAPAGIAFNGQAYAVSYSGQNDHWRSIFHGVGAEGATLIAPKQVVTVASDAFAGPMIWNGSVFATAWEDRRDNDYEIYFNLLDADGDRLGPDVRLSNGYDFSLHPDVLWNGTHFVVLWDDQRLGLPQLYGRLLGVDGAVASEELPLTDSSLEAESPQLAQGRKGLGVAFKYGTSDAPRIGFATLANDLTTMGPLVELGDDRAVSPTITTSGGRYFVAWHTRKGRGPGDAIWGAVLDEDGSVLVAERQLTFGALFARGETWLPLGDRLLLVWGADFGSGYDLYAKLLTLDLEEASPPMQVTSTPTDTLAPLAAFGPDGDVGIVFRDQLDGSWHTYFTRLRCLSVTEQ